MYMHTYVYSCGSCFGLTVRAKYIIDIEHEVPKARGGGIGVTCSQIAVVWPCKWKGA